MFRSDRALDAQRGPLAGFLARLGRLALPQTRGAAMTSHGAPPPARDGESYLGARKDLFVYFMP